MAPFLIFMLPLPGEGGTVTQFEEHAVELLNAAKTTLQCNLHAVQFAFLKQVAGFGDVQLLDDFEDSHSGICPENPRQVAFGGAGCNSNVVQRNCF